MSLWGDFIHAEAEVTDIYRCQHNELQHKVTDKRRDMMQNNQSRGTFIPDEKVIAALQLTEEEQKEYNTYCNKPFIKSTISATVTKNSSNKGNSRRRRNGGKACSGIKI